MLIFPPAVSPKVLNESAGQATRYASHTAGQVLRMDPNGRLTTPPRIEAVLVTNSGDGLQRISARGFSLDIYAQLDDRRFAAKRNARTACARRLPASGPGPVFPAAQFLFALSEVAAGV